MLWVGFKLTSSMTLIHFILLEKISSDYERETDRHRQTDAAAALEEQAVGLGPEWSSVSVAVLWFA